MYTTTPKKPNAALRKVARVRLTKEEHVITADGKESKTTDAYIVQTLPRIVPVDFVQTISNLPNSVKLVWKPHQDKRVGYYRIEKYNTLINEWILLKTIKENNLDLEYLYAFTHDKKDKAILLLHTDNLNALIDALIKNEIVIVPPEEVYNL